MMTDITIASVSKNAREEIRVVLTNYKGHDLVDLRVFVEADGRADRVPTRKGIAVKPALLPALIEALAKARLATGGDA
jgi:hypothetical protein